MKLKDPGSAITHFIGMLMSAFAALPLLIKASGQPDKIHVISLSIFIVSMTMLYAASTLYHSLDLSEKANTVLKKIDHCMISVMIAGSYTPVCLLVLKGRMGIILLSLVWGLAIAGIIIKLFYVNCPRWFSSFLYIAMGWCCILAFTQILNSLPRTAFLLLLAGGVIYTAGGVIYAIKCPKFNERHKNFGNHEIFHVFIMAGSVCHFIMMYQYLA
ncbi:hemolysin III [Acetitomaculum ruminis DSM 5522]|uniref:Hemolysin III n=1 Tax=Acetitomaculum ruminis DSM 5522 TaxID=1120918 RepID=A0A1I0ZBD4_9FIRM|nr:hemolysin III family protein [Acetitomaculum ruminis]SFB22712.1 hemolysin III [Acetitomaculum ruminis DSM 5522]